MFILKTSLYVFLDIIKKLFFSISQRIFNFIRLHYGPNAAQMRTRYNEMYWKHKCKLVLVTCTIRSNSFAITSDAVSRRIIRRIAIQCEIGMSFDRYFTCRCIYAARVGEPTFLFSYYFISKTSEDFLQQFLKFSSVPIIKLWGKFVSPFITPIFQQYGSYTMNVFNLPLISLL